MATDATGAPTPLGIPKYNTSADAPSGLGFNAAMDAIDALISARVNKPAGLTTGDVPVWNGSTFVRPTGTASSSVYLRGDGAWASAPGAGYTTAAVSGANTDLTWPGGGNSLTYVSVTTGGGTLRSIGAPTLGAGARVVLRNGAASAFTVIHATAGGGPQLYLRNATNLVMNPGDHVEFIYDGSEWMASNHDNVRTTTSTLAGGPPAGPIDGDIWVATAVDAFGTRWTFQYNAASAGPKWEFIGGSPLYFGDGGASQANIAAATAVALTTGFAVPNIPRTGDYIIEGWTAFNTGGSAVNVTDIEMWIRVGGVTDGSHAALDLLTATGGGGDIYRSLYTLDKFGGRTAGETIQMFGQTSYATNNWYGRKVRITPVRVS